DHQGRHRLRRKAAARRRRGDGRNTESWPEDFEPAVIGHRAPMKRFGLTPLLVLAAVATAMLVAASYTPVFPGDRALAGFIQAWVPAGAWAQAVTRAAYAPWVYAILVVSMIGAFRIAGWRAAVAMAVTFFALEYSETALKEYIGRPRPGPGMSG